MRYFVVRQAAPGHVPGRLPGHVQGRMSGLVPGYACAITHLSQESLWLESFSRAIFTCPLQVIYLDLPYCINSVLMY